MTTEALKPWTQEELEARKRLERIADDFASNWNDAIDVEEAPPAEIEIDTADVEAIRLILSRPAPTVCPDGWKLVPVEPTEAMCAEGRACVPLSLGAAAVVFKSMLAAAPLPPLQTEGEGT